jgi:hypothetical protein
MRRSFPPSTGRWHFPSTCSAYPSSQRPRQVTLKRLLAVRRLYRQIVLEGDELAEPPAARKGPAHDHASNLTLDSDSPDASEDSAQQLERLPGFRPFCAVPQPVVSTAAPAWPCEPSPAGSWGNFRSSTISLHAGFLVGGALTLSIRHLL